MLGNKSKTKFYRTGGTRGGQAQFKWDDVKTDTQRENYLGNSVNAAVGRWQKNKDLYWYNKLDKDEIKALEDEKLRIKQLDEDVLNEAIGIKVKRKRDFSSDMLDPTEIKQLLHRGTVDREITDSEHIKGLGAAPVKFHEHIPRLSSIEKDIKKIKEGGEITASNIQYSIPGNAAIETNGSLSVDRSQNSIKSTDMQEKIHKKHKSHDSDEKKKHKHKDKDKKESKHKHKSDHKHKNTD